MGKMRLLEKKDRMNVQFNNKDKEKEDCKLNDHSSAFRTLMKEQRQRQRESVLERKRHQNAILLISFLPRRLAFLLLYLESISLFLS